MDNKRHAFWTRILVFLLLMIAIVLVVHIIIGPPMTYLVIVVITFPLWQKIMGKTIKTADTLITPEEDEENRIIARSLKSFSIYDFFKIILPFALSLLLIFYLGSLGFNHGSSSQRSELLVVLLIIGILCIVLFLNLVIYYKLKRVNALLYHYASAKGWSIIKRETHPLKSIWASSIISKRIADHKLEVFCEADTLLNTKILTIITVDNVFLKVPVLVGKDIINNNIVPRSLQFRTPMRVPSRLIRTGDSGFDKKLRLYSRDREYALGVIRDDIKKLLVSLDLNVYLGKDKTIVGWEGHPKTSGELNGKISIITEIVKGISKIGGSR